MGRFHAKGIIAYLMTMAQVVFLTSSLPMQVTSQSLSCPDLSSDPVVIPTGGSSSNLIQSINKSSVDSVCVLVRVSPTPGNNVDMRSVTITRSSITADYNIIPVARSYDNNDWERVAGPFDSKLQISGCCSLNIPMNLHGMTNDSSKFQLLLMSFSTSLTSQEEVSRFFQQATFGPTKSMINSWNYGKDLQTGMKDWVSSQMDETKTPVTSHREYFRKRMDGQAFFQKRSRYYGPKFPCDEFSRWRDYTFDRNDWGKQFYVSGAGGGMYLISEYVNNQYKPRTVVSEWKWEYNDSDLGMGFFTFCKFPSEEVGGSPLRINVGGCKNVKGGNPIVSFPNGIHTSALRNIDLPDISSFGTIEPITNPNYYEPENVVGGAFYLKNKISNASCNQIPKNGDYTDVIGTFPDGKKVFYMNYIELDENTIENPISNGGASVFGTSDRSLMDDFYCPVVSKNFKNIDSCYLSVAANACTSIYGEQHLDKVKAKGYMDAVVVCGSEGEVKNDPLSNNVFQYYGSTTLKMDQESVIQKSNVWTMIALQDGDTHDQLRQRVAWALSQILVVTSKQINDLAYAEIYLNYYDIFVRNAFGNYFDILKEVSYSPMMAEMLSFLGSKSQQFVLEDEGTFAYPDENYAREIMQLFSMGTTMLNMDGTTQVNSGGSPILSYDNTDIQNFARAWTGFTRQESRSNMEFRENEWNKNRMDPMKIYGPWRDPFPKMDLGSGFIGDRVPLCIDLPNQQFLKAGATYRLLGSSIKPEMHDQPIYWDWSYSTDDIKIFKLDSTSVLRSTLSADGFKPTITLDSEVACSGTSECTLDTVRIVQVQENPDIFYEYVRPPCVELAFFAGKKISTEFTGQTGGTPMFYRKSMCAHDKLHVGMVGCCLDNSNPTTRLALNYCDYSLDRTSFAWALDKCQKDAYTAGDLCDWTQVNSAMECREDLPENWFWTNREECKTRAKVNEDGMVAIVHMPTLLTGVNNFEYRIDPRVHPDNQNYFKVTWENDTFPNSSNSCGNGLCQTVYRGCLCELDIVESKVFNAFPSSKSNLLSELHIGAVDPSVLGSYTQVPNTGNIISVWHKNGGYDEDTIFSVHYQNKKVYLKNVISTVKVRGSDVFKFRNPPHFINIAIRDPRDAYYETDYVLETYFYHSNVAPYLAKAMIKRFGVSNPSPRYVEAVATAFKDGMYEGIGDGKYGNMKAMVAAVILDREARSVILDADPTYGSFKEPLSKFIAFMRGMNFRPQQNVGEEVRLVDLHDSIGQEPHKAPNVFSFFLPEYASPGHVKSAMLTSPEAQIFTGPKIINMLNGINSLVDIGLQNCYGGLGFMSIYPNNCNRFQSYYDPEERHNGKIEYSPPNPNDAEGVIDDLSLILTGGRLRLNSVSKSIIVDAYKNAGNNADGLRLAQKLITSIPEFHTTNVVYSTSSPRDEIQAPQPASNRYKAVVFIFLEGGMDSYNMLMPHSGCTQGQLSHEHYRSVRGQLHIPLAVLLPIDAQGSSQPCSTFGLHPNLPIAQSLYNDNDLLFVANMGVLQEPVTEDNFWEKTDKTQLFSHNVQTDEVEHVDIHADQAGRGIGGRMIDSVIQRGLSAGGVSVSGISEVLVSDNGSLFTVDSKGLQTFNPMPWAQPLKQTVMDLNRGTNIGSGIFGETWSNLVYKSFGENDLLYDALNTATLGTNFPETPFGSQMETIAKLIKTRNERGHDRDVFYAKMPNFDTHGNMNENLGLRMIELNGGLSSFVTEIRDIQQSWDDVTIVLTSEFGRTLTGNTGNGSDHAWGGNYFIAGGEVEGKKILGKYPNSISEDSPEVVPPGVVIPSTPWEALWNGVAQWFGVTTSSSLDEVVPNRQTFSNNLFSQSDLYKGTFTDPPTSATTPTPTAAPTMTQVTPAPTRSPTKSPSVSPTRSPTEGPTRSPTKAPSTSPVVTPINPTVSPTKSMTPTKQLLCNTEIPTIDPSHKCYDSPLKFQVTIDDVFRDCEWVRDDLDRCDLNNVKWSCPATCGVCDTCKDSNLKFKLFTGDKVLKRSCNHVARNVEKRCKYFGIADTCRKTCSTCEFLPTSSPTSLTSTPTTDLCKPSTSTADSGHKDEFRGWYDWSGCGKCFDYCRWIGYCGSGGDPSIRTTFTCMRDNEVKKGWWMCRKAGTDETYSNSWSNPFGGSFGYTKCATKG